MDNPYEYFNPLNYASASGYVAWWQAFLNSAFHGMWARIFAAIYLILAFWHGVFRQRFQWGILLFALALITTYLGGILRILFWRFYE